MNYYLAPLEGITGYIYRNIIHDLYGEQISKYFTPFFMPHTKRSMISKEINQILPENNPGQYLVPQILTNSAEDFLRFQKEMKSYGYEEINLNLGCPSNTVAKKGRGSGFLRYPVALNDFLYEIFAHSEGKISIKTRLGWDDPDEFEEILEMYNQYAMEELIIHPRVRMEFYEGQPHRDIFLKALERSKTPVVYNGDIWTREDADRLFDDCRNMTLNDAEAAFGSVCPLSSGLKTGDARKMPEAVMLGRGLVANPALAREISGGPEISMEEYRHYLERIREDYRGFLYGDTPVLYKLKEVWVYIARHYTGPERDLKPLLKCKSMDEYLVWEQKLLQSGKIDIHCKNL